MRLALGLLEGRLGITPTHMGDMSHSKWTPCELEHMHPIVNQVYISLFINVVAGSGGRAKT